MVDEKYAGMKKCVEEQAKKYGFEQKPGAAKDK